MFKVKISDQTVPLPDSWDEVSLDAYNRLTTWDGKSIPHLLAKITGVHAFTLVDDPNLYPLLDRLSWLTTAPEKQELSGTVTLGGRAVRYPAEISQERFQCKVMMDKNITGHAKKNLSITEAMTFTLAAYLYEPYNEKPWSIHRISDVNDFMTLTGAMSVPEAIALGEMYHEQGMILTEKWNRALSGGEYTNEQLRAGIKKLEKYGVWGMVNQLIPMLNLSREMIMQLPYEEVFLSLLYSKEQSEYQRKLHAILNPKKPHKRK